MNYKTEIVFAIMLFLAGLGIDQILDNIGLKHPAYLVVIVITFGTLAYGVLIP